MPTTPTARAFSYAILLLLGLVLTVLVLAGHDLPRDRQGLGVFLVVALPLYLLVKRADRCRRRSE